MKTTRVFESFAICWMAVVSAPPVLAETKGTFNGSIEAAAQATKAAFAELKIAKVDEAVTFVFATFVGRAESGSRILVSVNRAGDGATALKITSDGPEEPALEKKLLEAIRAREGEGESSAIGLKSELLRHTAAAAD